MDRVDRQVASTNCIHPRHLDRLSTLDARQALAHSLSVHSPLALDMGIPAANTTAARLEGPHPFVSAHRQHPWLALLSMAALPDVKHDAIHHLSAF